MEYLARFVKSGCPAREFAFRAPDDEGAKTVARVNVEHEIAVRKPDFVYLYRLELVVECPITDL